MRYTDSMNNGNEIPDKPYNRYEVPTQLINDIDVIGAKFSTEFADLDMTDGDDIEDVEAESRERKKIVELLKMIVEPSTGNDYSDRMRAEVAVKLLDQMGYPVEAFDHILGMGYAPEMIADKMMEEAGESDD